MLRIPKERSYGAGKRRGVTRGNEQGRAPVLEYLGTAVDRRGHDGLARGHGFEQGQRRAFIERGNGEHVDGAEQVGYVGAMAGEADAVGKA